MGNLLRDLFNKNYYSDMLKQQQKEWKETRDCFTCKRCLDQSDKYNTYHECEYGGPLPKEHTCLLWEEKDA